MSAPLSSKHRRILPSIRALTYAGCGTAGVGVCACVTVGFGIDCQRLAPTLAWRRLNGIHVVGVLGDHTRSSFRRSVGSTDGCNPGPNALTVRSGDKVCGVRLAVAAA